MLTKIRNKQVSRQLYSNLILIFTILISTNSQSQTVTNLESLAITYKLSLKSDSLGNATLGKISNTLNKTETGYKVESFTKAQGLAAIIIGSNEQQSCDFNINNDGSAIPQRYSGGTIKKDKYHVNFDWSNRKLRFENDETLDMPKGYILDLCSMPFALALNQGKGLEETTLYVVDGKKKRIRGYSFLSSSNEQVATPLGTKNTLKLVLQRELRPKRTLTVWFSTDDHYVPIKIEEKREHRTITMVVSELETN